MIVDGLVLFGLLVLGCGIGILWMRRITDYEEFTGRPSWRFLALPGRFGRPIVTPRRPPTRRWLITRAEMAIGIACIPLATIGPNVLYPTTGSGHGAVLLVGVGGLIVGNVWLYRVMRASAEPDAVAWRYRR